MSRYHSGYNLLYCKKCSEGILKSLESSVMMPIIINACDTFQHTDKFAYIPCTAKTVNGRWKFTNDSRRIIIKKLRNLPAE